jgi:hypothetical protein
MASSEAASWADSSVPYREEGALPDTTITIDRGQREALYELVRNHLGGIGDVWIALGQKGDAAAAERLGLEFAEDLRLLQDIGWSERDEREGFELTLPPHDLMKLLQRLQGEAVGMLIESGTEAQVSREEADADKRVQLGYEACEKILIRLDPRELHDTPPAAREA